MTMPTVLDLGPLAGFHAAGVLELPDVHVAAGLFRIAGLPLDAHTALAAALCVRLLREGSVCVDLAGDPTAWAPEEPDPVVGAPPDAAVPGDVPFADLVWPDPQAWVAQVAAHPLVDLGPTGGGDLPLRLVGARLYLQRYWADEQLVRTQIAERSRPVAADLDALTGSLTRLFPGTAADRQRLAVAIACLRGVSIVAGGPGTGKTTTVARLLAVLHEVHEARAAPERPEQPEGRRRPLTVGLAAPTGKAAARLQEAVGAALAGMDEQDRRRIGEARAGTLHRLLGWRPGSRSRFGHHRGNPLPHDVVIVDETSMVSLSLMARLLEALRPDAQLVLVGDPDQLASVDAGAVLGDLVAAATPWADPVQAESIRIALERCCPHDDSLAAAASGVVVLDRTFRYGGAIAALADAVRGGRAEEALDVLGSGWPDVCLLDTSDPAEAERALDDVRSHALAQAEALATAADRGAADEALAALESFRVLCAHRHGRHGVQVWNARIATWTRSVGMTTGSLGPPGAPTADALAGQRAAPSGHLRASDPPGGRGQRDEQWWIGRPLLVTANDYAAEVYNGDTGVVVRGPSGQPRAAFTRADGPMWIAPARLQSVETLHAMTIHRGQGSQFGRVAVVLPPPESPLLTRELLYTAITRARAQVQLIGTPEAVRAAVGRPVRRASGLRDPLPGPSG